MLWRKMQKIQTEIHAVCLQKSKIYIYLYIYKTLFIQQDQRLQRLAVLAISGYNYINLAFISQEQNGFCVAKCKNPIFLRFQPFKTYYPIEVSISVAEAPALAPGEKVVFRILFSKLKYEYASKQALNASNFEQHNLL